MQNTAIQHAINFLSDGLGNLDESVRIQDIWNELHNLQPFNKQQIIDAANDAIAQYDSNYIANPDLGEQYYKQNYNN